MNVQPESEGYTQRLRRCALASTGAFFLGLALLAGEHAIAADKAPQRSRTVISAGEARIDVIVDGTGPAVVLLPSSQRDSEDFDELASRMAAAGFRVLRPQPRGMGASTGPMDKLTLHTLANDVAETVRQLGAGRAVLVGHAYGHFVARVVDLDHPALVRGVVVAGAAAKVFPPQMVQSLAIAATPTEPEAERRKHLQIAFFAPGNDPGVWLGGWHPSLREVYRKAATVPAKETWWDVTNAPILDLQGSDDPWRPKSTANELKDLLGDKVTVQTVPNASHALIPEQPAAVASAIVAWIRTLKP